MMNPLIKHIFQLSKYRKSLLLYKYYTNIQYYTKVVKIGYVSLLLLLLSFRMILESGNIIIITQNFILLTLLDFIINYKCMP